MPETIKCPTCKHRLFDVKSGGVDIEIKCSRCKKVINVKRTLKKNKINHTEQGA